MSGAKALLFHGTSCPFFPAFSAALLAPILLTPTTSSPLAWRFICNHKPQQEDHSMFASSIASSAQQNIASFQAQQQQKAQQQFQSLAAQFQSGGLSTAQINVASQETLPSSSSETSPSAPPTSEQNGPEHSHHHHLHMDPGGGGTLLQVLDPLTSSNSPSSAQQAYATLGQDSTASDQSASQSSTLSLTF
jgi:hypothetical protein